MSILTEHNGSPTGDGKSDAESGKGGLSPTRWWSGLSKPFRIAFISACVMGVITHLYIFTNLLLNHDSVWRTYYSFGSQGMMSGRWALGVASDFTTRFQLPVVIGLVSILFLALSAAFTVRILDISNPLCIVFTSGLMVTFPSVACILSYMFTADAYFVALFLNTFGVYCVKRYRYGWAVGILLFVIACGIYQAFISWSIGLLLFDCLLMLLSDKDVRLILKTGLKYIAILLFSLVTYYIVVKVILFANNLQLTSYQGMDQFKPTNIASYLAFIPKTYKNFIRFFLHTPYQTKAYQLMQIIACLVFPVCLVYLMAVRRIWKDPLRLMLVAVGTAMIPFALNFITVLTGEGGQVHNLMIYSFILLFIFTLKFAQDAFTLLEYRKHKIPTAIPLVGGLLCALLIWDNFCISNIAYLRLQLTYENSFALANRIAARIEMLDGYSPDTSVAIVGEASRKLYGNTIEEFSQINSLTGTGDILLYSPEPHMRTREFICNYIGIRMPRPNGEQLAKLKESETVKTMPSYPSKGSVAIVDGVIVVKLGDGTVR